MRWAIIILMEIHILLTVSSGTFYDIDTSKYQGIVISSWTCINGEEIHEEQMPYQIEKMTGQNTIVLETVLEKVRHESNTLLLQTDAATIQAYMDDILIYNSRDSEYFEHMYYHTRNWNEIQLPQKGSAQTLRIELTPLSWNDELNIYETFLSDYATADFIITSSVGINMIFGTLVMLGMLGVLILSLACGLVKGVPIFNYLFLFAILDGIVNVANYFCDSDTSNLNMLEPYWIMIAIVIALFLYLNYAYHISLKNYSICMKIMRIMGYVIAINYVILLLHQLRGMSIIITCIISIGTTAVMMGVVWIKERKASQIQIASVITIFLTVLIDLYKMATGDWVLLGSATSLSVGCNIFIIFFADLIHLVRFESINMSKKEKNIDYKIALMQSQIKPHFLYNTLNSISWLCKSDPAKADEAIIRFSKFLRSNMKSLDEAELIPFEKEMEHVKNYVQLEILRFPIIQVEYELEYEKFFIPSLTVQPLVENAIKHGVSKREEGGVVTISSRVEADNIIVEIKDNGIGYNTLSYDANKSTGIRNVKQRLELCCNAVVAIHSTQGEGTSVTIKIPANQWEGELDEDHIR